MFARVHNIHYIYIYIYIYLYLYTHACDPKQSSSQLESFATFSCTTIPIFIIVIQLLHWELQARVPALSFYFLFKLAVSTNHNLPDAIL